MAKYDNTGDVKRRRFPLFLTIFIIGIVLFIVGVVLIKVTNTKSLGKRYSYNETFEVATIDNMEIDFSAGDLNIKKSSDENIHVTGENLPEKINFSSSNSKLQVKTADSLLHLKGGYISFDGSQPTLTIELPEKAFDTVSFMGCTCIKEYLLIKPHCVIYFIFGKSAVFKQSAQPGKILKSVHVFSPPFSNNIRSTIFLCFFHSLRYSSRAFSPFGVM